MQRSIGSGEQADSTTGRAGRSGQARLSVALAGVLSASTWVMAQDPLVREIVREWLSTLAYVLAILYYGLGLVEQTRVKHRSEN